MNKGVKMMAVAVAGLVVVAIIVVAVIFSGRVTIPAGKIGVDTESGEILRAGTYFRFASNIELIDSRSQKYTLEGEILTDDKESIGCEMTVFYRIGGENSHLLLEEYGADSDLYGSSLIEPALISALKKESGKYGQDNILTSLEKIEESIKKNLELELADYGLIVDGCTLGNFDFPEVETTVSVTVTEAPTQNQTSTTAQSTEFDIPKDDKEYDSDGILIPYKYNFYSSYETIRNGYCNVKSCHIMTMPDNDSPKRQNASLYRGDPVTVYGIVNGYYYIGTDNGDGTDVKGYVKANYIKIGTPAADPNKSYFATQGVVEVDSANVRSSPSKNTNANVITVLKKGHGFEILSFDGYWYYINYGEGCGYISHKMVSVW